MAINLPDPLAPETKDVWGNALNAALSTLDDTITGAVTTAQNAAAVASTANTALGGKADASSVYPKTTADARFVRTINGSPPINGDVVVSPVPGIRAIYWDGTGSQPARSSQTTDTSQPVIWMTPLAHPPTIGTGYAIDGSVTGQARDLWFVLP